MARRTYSAAPGAPFSDRDARLIGPALEDMASRRGGALRPEEVVEEAASPAHPLHPYFEWDDSAAADRYRVQQARQMIASVRVRVVDPKGRRAPFKAWFSVRRDDRIGRAYVPLEEVAAQAPLREQVVADALRELQAWSARYRAYQEMDGLRVELERLVHGELRRRGIRRKGRARPGSRRSKAPKPPAKKGKKKGGRRGK